MAEPETGMSEACGVFGCVSASPWPTQLEVANIIYLGLTALQHRGQESAGITMSMGCHDYRTHKGMGLVSQVFTETIMQNKLKGNLGIGHTRYSTSGSSDPINCQPFVVETIHGRIAVAHNGELINAKTLKRKILRSGVGLTTGTDSELITQMLSLPPKEEQENGEPNWVSRIKQFMEVSHTSYSVTIMYKDSIYAVRDSYGNRPLCIGKLVLSAESDASEGWVVSSESCSFQSIGAKYYREVLPGEIVRISREGIQSMCVVPPPDLSPPAFCIFEYVYFARPDSIFEGQMVYSVRQRCGIQLAIEAGVAADLVSTVPESATPSAIGFAMQSGLPYGEILCKNRYVGRTFIQPSTRLRQMGVNKKFGALVENIKGKRIVLLDDSIVRGNTMGPIVRLVKSAGAKEVHVRIASPPLKHPCYMGINIPTKEELIANKLNLPELARHLGADSVVYLSVEGLLKAVQSGIKHEPMIHSTSESKHQNNTKTTERSQSTSAEPRNAHNLQSNHAERNNTQVNVNSKLLHNECDTTNSVASPKIDTVNGDAARKVGHCTACLTGIYPSCINW